MERQTVLDRRNRAREQRREEFLDAAEQLFFAEGLSGTTMDRVAATRESIRFQSASPRLPIDCLMQEYIRR